MKKVWDLAELIKARFSRSYAKTVVLSCVQRGDRACGLAWRSNVVLHDSWCCPFEGQTVDVPRPYRNALRVLSKAFSIKRTNNVPNIFIGVLKMKKLSSLADSENKALLAEICNWIDKNTSPNIGWTELIETTGLTHKELQFLFDKYLNTTSMTYIRERRKE